MARCRSCGAQAIWATSKTTGKAMLVDAKPVADGNVILRDVPGGPLFEVLGRASADQAHEDRITTYTSHFATCPNAKTHRRS